MSKRLSARMRTERRRFSLISAMGLPNAGSIAVNNANDADEVVCNKPEAPAKGMNHYL